MREEWTGESPAERRLREWQEQHDETAVIYVRQSAAPGAVEHARRVDRLGRCWWLDVVILIVAVFLGLALLVADAASGPPPPLPPRPFVTPSTTPYPGGWEPPHG